MKTQNCWEFSQCDHTECEARHDTLVDGVHGGKNGGRCCWTVAGTLHVHRRVKHGRKVLRDARLSTGIEAKNKQNCRECDFYQKTEGEAGQGFLSPLQIFQQYKDKK